MTPEFRAIKRRVIARALNSQLSADIIDRVLATRDIQELMSTTQSIYALDAIVRSSVRFGVGNAKGDA